MLLHAAGALHAADGSGSGPGHAGWSEGTTPESEARKPRILVVDDEKRIADTISEILNASGFEAVAAYDGWSALDTAGRFGPDYLLSDVLMPRMNGAELAIAIRRRFPAAKILLFSGQAGISEILQNAQERGYTFDLLAKPVHPVRLLERVRQL